MNKNTAPPQMHFPLAALYAKSGYLIRLTTWTGNEGEHELAWLNYSGGIWFYIVAATKVVRVVKAGTTATNGDITPADLAAWNWTTLPPNCSTASICPCGDLMQLELVPPFEPLNSRTSRDWSNPNASLGAPGCVLPPADWTLHTYTGDCDCFVPLETDYGRPDPAKPCPAGMVLKGGECVKSGGGTGGGGSTVSGGGGGSGSYGEEGGFTPSPGKPGPTNGVGGGGGGGGGGGNTPSIPPGNNDPGTGGEGASPSVVVTVTRDNDQLVPCEGSPAGDQCPDTSSGYGWFGNFSLSGVTDHGKMFSYKVIWQGNIIESGLMDAGDTVDWGPVSREGRPGSTAIIQVTADELLGDQHASGSGECRIPSCDCTPTPTCPEGQVWDDNLGRCVTPQGGDGGTTPCPEGAIHNQYSGECECIPPRTLDAGECKCPNDAPIFVPECNVCRDNCPEGSTWVVDDNQGNHVCSCVPDTGGV